MRRALLVLPILLLLSWSIVLCAEEETVAFGRFGHITLYRQSPEPSQVVLFVSGDGGWNLGVIDMVRALAKIVAMKGAHHFGGDYDAIAARILKEAR